jgi:hypothetical protein
MFGALIRKIFIVMRLLQSSKNLAVKVQSQRHNQICTVMTVLLMIAFDAVIIVTWSLLSPAIPSAKIFKVPFIGEILYLTSSSSPSCHLRLFSVLQFHRISVLFCRLFHNIFHRHQHLHL